MSKHFGRSQKRKLRERIAELETAYQLESGLKSHIRRTRDQLSRTLAVVERVLGKHFAALPPQEIRVPASFRNTPVINLLLEGRFKLSFTDTFQPIPVSERCEIVQAWLLHTDVEFEPLRHEVHVVLSYEGANQPRAAYMISEGALATMHQDDLVQHIAPMLARSLLEALPSHATRG